MPPKSPEGTARPKKVKVPSHKMLTRHGARVQEVREKKEAARAIANKNKGSPKKAVVKRKKPEEDPLKASLRRVNAKLTAVHPQIHLPAQQGKRKRPTQEVEDLEEEVMKKTASDEGALKAKKSSERVADRAEKRAKRQQTSEGDVAKQRNAGRNSLLDQPDIIPLPPAKKSAKSEKTPTEDPEGNSAAVYLGHLPYGFYETEMLKFFKQFGKVKFARISRSRTGKSRGYAYILFHSPDVAEVVAEAMDGYIMSKKVLVCNVIKNKDFHPELFFGEQRHTPHLPISSFKPPTKRIRTLKRGKTAQATRQAKLNKKDKKKAATFKKLGIAYSFPTYAESLEKK